LPRWLGHSGGMVCLGIETSCDETAVAVVRDHEVLAERVASQVAEHAPFGGVVPELASRRHLETLDDLVTASLAEAGVELGDVDLIAVTRGPGLLVALLVGMQYAKGLAAGLDVPLIGVNHVTAHLEAVHLEAAVAYPYLGLVVSGGHTHLFRVAGPAALTLIGHTVDDAAGEAYDKVGKMVGLPYPSGAVLDGFAQQGNPAAIALPRPMLDRDNLLFSFSGLKTAVRTHLSRAGQLPETGGTAPSGEALHDLAASFQAAAVETIVTKTVRAARQEGLERVVVGGGVACNTGLRAGLAAVAGLAVHFLPPRYCTDNGVMVAALGAAQYAAGVRHDLSLAPIPGLAALLDAEQDTAMAAKAD
jgi:N6-L-threonylcarbamoyladenine synthase